MKLQLAAANIRTLNRNISRKCANYILADLDPNRQGGNWRWCQNTFYYNRQTNKHYSNTTKQNKQYHLNIECVCPHQLPLVHYISRSPEGFEHRLRGVRLLLVGGFRSLNGSCVTRIYRHPLSVKRKHIAVPSRTGVQTHHFNENPKGSLCRGKEMVE